MSAIIKVENISKQYRLGQIGTGTIGHDLNRWWAQLRGKEDPYLKIGETNDRSKKGFSDYVWALKDINFEVNQGEVLGIIGKNGAGKSTLLKILSKTTAPTTGSIKIKGRIASLLEVGTGFHPDLSGRENIFLNGAILGMTKREIKAKFDEIVDFSGVERYIDTPVKRYSSGMYVRLAFAVAAHLEPEILILDEVLAVGDVEFQKKCLGKMKDVSVNDGRTVLFVSHNLSAISQLCKNAVLLSNGKVVDINETSLVINKYYQQHLEINQIHEIKFEGLLKTYLQFLELNVNGINPFANELIVHPTQQIIFQLKLFAEKNIPPFRLSLAIFKDNVRLFSMSDYDFYESTYGHFSCLFTIDKNVLRAGTYQVGIGSRTEDNLWIWNEHVCSFNVSEVYDGQMNILDYGILNSKIFSTSKRNLNDT